NSPKNYFEEPEWLLKFLELPFNKGILVWSVVNICQSTASQATCFLGCFDVGNINHSLSLLDIAPTNYYVCLLFIKTVPSSGLNHVCMILVALFSFQRTPHSFFSSVALLRRASLRPKITSCSSCLKSFRFVSQLL
ncbi:MAG: hypothetical protein J6N55_06145, partial [Anaerovibrio sp.]|uniref:hypothetical protein n=1 Tax=Anaerovibrio sp. TaxID=1872532 RepID=UPI001B253F93